MRSSLESLGGRPLVSAATIVAFLTACGAYKYEDLALPYEPAIALAPAHGTDPPRKILRVSRAGGQTVTLWLLHTTPDSLVGLVNFENPDALRPDTLALSWTDVESVELRSPTVAHQATAVLIIGVLVGGSVILLTKGFQYDP